MASEIQPQLINDKIPQYILNKHTTYENTMLNVYSSIIGSLKDTQSAEALLADQGRLFIAGLKKEKAEKFIEDNYQTFYDQIYPTVKANTTDNQKRITIAMVWEKLIMKAFADWLNDHHVDHTRAKLAVLDRFTPDGKEIVELPDVEYLPIEDINFKEPGYRAAWSYAQFVAHEITGPKNIDRKIFVVGDAGDGKSMTGLCLALRIAFWVAYYENLKLIKAGKPATAKLEDYFKFDSDHVACINAKDLIHVATAQLARYSIKILDDFGAALGFTNRRSMTTENLDVISIISTNRVQNGVMIYCLHTEDFADVRMRMLANDKIDLTDYTESNGIYRIAKLYKIKRAKGHKNKINECKFAFHWYGEYTTIEGIVCFMPDKPTSDLYNELRLKKESENTRSIKEKYVQIEKKQEIEDNKPRCPNCHSKQIPYYSKRKGTKSCRACGYEY